MKENIYKFREVERSILEWLLERHIETGNYFNKREQHYKMCKELLKKLEY